MSIAKQENLRRHGRLAAARFTVKRVAIGWAKVTSGLVLV
jgi:hypothetical protein